MPNWVRKLRFRYWSSLPSHLCRPFIFIPIALFCTDVLAQGQDGAPFERDLLVLSALFPGVYDNANQAYFDQRLNVPDAKRHGKMHIEIDRIDAPKFGDHVFVSTNVIGDETESKAIYLYSIETDNLTQSVRMKTYSLNGHQGKKITKSIADYIEGCDLLWRRELGHYRGRLENDDCEINEAHIFYEMQISDDGFWLSLSADVVDYYKMIRARDFTCYIDVPGVGGGRDILFERYAIDALHDLGDEAWVKTNAGQEIGVSLFRVYWTFNNYDDVFARPSFVIYVKTKEENSEVKEVGYSFTSPDAERIGINLKWALAYCYQISNEDIEPFFRDEPKVSR